MSVDGKRNLGEIFVELDSALIRLEAFDWACITHPDDETAPEKRATWDARVEELRAEAERVVATLTGASFDSIRRRLA